MHIDACNHNCQLTCKGCRMQLSASLSEVCQSEAVLHPLQKLGGQRARFVSFLVHESRRVILTLVVTPASSGPCQAVFTFRDQTRRPFSHPGTVFRSKEQ
eukprot:4428239-Amphidinium_carterae.2